jgi:hypothetical protein
MACRELAALRLGLMNVVGIVDDAEKQHELNELGDACETAGPLKSMMESTNLEDLKKFYEASLSDLNQKLAKMEKDDPKLAYHQSLMILTKKVEQDLSVQINNFQQMWKDLDEIHHLTHEIYPA